MTLRIYLVIVCISLIQGLQFVVSPVLGKIGEHYSGIDISLVQMLVTVPAFIGLFFGLLSGILIVKISKKQLLLFGALVAAIFGVVPFFADNFWVLFVCRLIYGISLGLATSLNTAVVAEWFTGDARVTAMGVQAASVGLGMMVSNALGGILGASDFRGAYFVNLLGLISFFGILFGLPETGTVAQQAKSGNTDAKIRINKYVIIIALIAFFEFMFLIVFSTNISMHISGSLKGNTTVAGTLSSIFSGSQIIVGLILGLITKVARKYTMPLAMGSFALGALLVFLFPSSFAMLAVGALFCGFSQGIFVPTGMVEVSNAVPAAAAAMASAVFSCGANIGQTISPFVLNNAARAIFGSKSTSNVFLLSAIGSAVAMVAVIIYKTVSKDGEAEE